MTHHYAPGIHRRLETIDKMDPGLSQALALSLNAPKYDQPPYDGEPSSYMICSTARSGGNLLCRILTNTGVAGIPHEYLNFGKYAVDLMERLGLTGGVKFEKDRTSIADQTLIEYVTRLKKLRTTSNGVFGVKCHMEHVIEFIQRRGIGHLFPECRYINLQRRDLVAQAVSFELATQTGRWTSQEVMQREPEYDGEAIDLKLTDTVVKRGFWSKYFAVNEIVPLEIWHEDLIADPESTVRSILSFLEIECDAPLAIDTGGLDRQGEQLNQEWIARYKRDYAQ